LDVGKGKQTDTLLEDEYPRSVKYMLFSGRWSKVNRQWVPRDWNLKKAHLC
jgi:hypothetical protein